MKLKKNAIAAAIATTLGIPAAVFADTINMTFTGAFTLVGGTGGINANGDAAVPGAIDGSSGFDLFGSPSPVTGTGTFDTTTGAGRVTIVPFSFFGNGLAYSTAVSLQHIGDGMVRSTDTLIAGVVDFYWGNVGFPIIMPVVWYAAGFFNSIGAPGTSWTVQSGCAACATSATPDTVFGHTIGTVPLAMTTYNFNPQSSGYYYPLPIDEILPLTNDDIVGSPMPTAPFPGQNAAFDFTSITATNVPQVPVQAAAWLFGSGLLGLVGIARRRRKNKI